nr:MAG: hypothetical protein [Apis mellifera filamentous virus]
MTKIRPINARHTPTATTTHRAKTRAENRAKKRTETRTENTNRQDRRHTERNYETNLTNDAHKRRQRRIRFTKTRRDSGANNGIRDRTTATDEPLASDTPTKSHRLV